MSRVGVIGDSGSITRRTGGTSIMRDDCINWKYSLDRNGYAQLRCKRRKKSTRAVRVLWEAKYGVELTAEQHLLHSCDNPRCINLDHIRVGTHQDNMADRRERNPFHGERNPMAKLTDLQASEILLDSRTSPHAAEDYNVTPQAIRLIRQGRNFSHLKEQGMQPTRVQARRGRA